MVDLKMSNEKLRNRARRVVQAVVPPSAVHDVSQEAVLNDILARCDGHVKLAILVATLNCSPEEGKARLEACCGSLRKALEQNQCIG